MPELPEVETVRTELEKTIQGAKIVNVHLWRTDLRVPVTAGFAQKVAGKRITKIERRAKYLLLYISGGDVIIIHLGMSGRITVSKVKPARQTHGHMDMALDNNHFITFYDPRRFGLMVLIKETELATHPLLTHLGPEPLEKEFSAAYLKKALSSRSAPVKTVIMDQSLVVGVGNIYASEALFLAGIDPRTPAFKAASRAPRLVKAIRQTLLAAIRSGGSTLRDYVRSSGDTGYFQHEFKVYGRKNKQCFQCDSIIEHSMLAGRATYYCTHCQQ